MRDSELHPKLKEILAIPGNPDAVPVECQTPAQARAEFDADVAAVDGPKPEVGSVEALSLVGPAGPLAARIYRPTLQGPGTSPLMVYFHGGGYIRGSIETHDSTVRVLCNALGFPIVSCSYRLAPEHPYPAAIEDAFAACQQVAARAANWGCDPALLVIGGDSAGGNIAAAVTMLARDGGGPPFAAQLLVYPVTDHEAATPSRAAFSSGYFLNSMPFYTASFLPDPAIRREALASPLHAPDLSRLPPAVVLTAGFDPLRDEALAYADRLEAAGVPVTRLHYSNMIHGFTLLRGLLPEADPALADCARAVRGILG